MADFEEGFDREKIGSAIIFGVFALIVIIGAFMWHHHAAAAPYVSACEHNPRERYAQPCADHDDCIAKCASRLASNGGT